MVGRPLPKQGPPEGACTLVPRMSSASRFCWALATGRAGPEGLGWGVEGPGWWRDSIPSRAGPAPPFDVWTPVEHRGSLSGPTPWHGERVCGASSQKTRLRTTTAPSSPYLSGRAGTYTTPLMYTAILIIFVRADEETDEVQGFRSLVQGTVTEP